MNVFGAIRFVKEQLVSLGETIGEIRLQLRGQFGLDNQEPKRIEAIPHEDNGNGAAKKAKARV